MEKRYDPKEEFTDRYPEYGRMFAGLNTRRIDYSKLLFAAMKLAALAAALGLLIAVSFSLRVDCALEEIGLTHASVRADAHMQELFNAARNPILHYRLERMPDEQEMQTAFLPAPDFLMEFDDLSPGTTYRLIFFYFDEKSGELRIAGTFLFTTLGEDGRGGSGKDARQDPNPPETTPETIVLQTSSPSPSLSPSPSPTPGPSSSPGPSPSLSPSPSPSLSPSPTVPVPPSGSLAITTEKLPSTKETYRYKAQIEVTYTGSGTLRYAAEGLPQGIDIDAATGEITGRSAEGTAGAYSVKVTATDGTLRAEKTYRLIVGKPSPEPETLTDCSIVSFVGHVEPGDEGVLAYFTIEIAPNDAENITLEVAAFGETLFSTAANAGTAYATDLFDFPLEDSWTATLTVRNTLGGAAAPDKTATFRCQHALLFDSADATTYGDTLDIRVAMWEQGILSTRSAAVKLYYDGAEVLSANVLPYVSYPDSGGTKTLRIEAPLSLLQGISFDTPQLWITYVTMRLSGSHMATRDATASEVLKLTFTMP